MSDTVVVPSYRLVWYNEYARANEWEWVVVPSYRLVWYNMNVSFFVRVSCCSQLSLGMV